MSKETEKKEEAMTRREKIAAMAMISIRIVCRGDSSAILAKKAVADADALIAELDKTGSGNK